MSDPPGLRLVPHPGARMAPGRSEYQGAMHPIRRFVADLFLELGLRRPPSPNAPRLKGRCSIWPLGAPRSMLVFLIRSTRTSHAWGDWGVDPAWLSRILREFLTLYITRLGDAARCILPF